jgi:hypothetical protein
MWNSWPDDFTFVLCLIGLSIVLLGTLLGVWGYLRARFACPLLFDLVAYAVLLKALLTFLLPAVLRGWSDWAFDRAVSVAPSEIVTVYAIEVGSYFIWFAGIAAVTALPGFRRRVREARAEGDGRGLCGKQASARTEGRMPQVALNGGRRLLETRARLFLGLCCVLYLSLYFQVSSEGANTAGIIAPYLWPCIRLAGPVVGLFVFGMGSREMGKLLFLLGLAASILAVTSGFASGIRAQVLGPSLWLLFMFAFVSRRLVVLVIILLGGLLTGMYANVMTNVRWTREYLDKDMVARTQALFRAASSGPPSEALVRQLEFRFGEASRQSVGFLRLYRSGRSAGLAPVMSALYAPFPRGLWAEKPIPGSIDGTTEGMGMYMIHGEVSGEWWNMSDFFTGLHAYWELGWVGVLAFGLVSAVFIAYVIRSFGSFGAAGLPFTMMALFPWWNEPKLWASQIILVSSHDLLVLVLLWLLAGAVVRSGRWVSGVIRERAVASSPWPPRHGN